MVRNSFRKGGAQYDKCRGSGRFQEPIPREKLRVSAKVASPGCILLQYKTDVANVVTVWLKRLSVTAMRECPTIGRVVEELEYRLAEEVVRPDFAAIVDEVDRYCAAKILEED